MTKPKKKYNNKEIIYNGIKFDSEMEKDYYVYLLINHSEPEITLQPKFEIQPKFTDNLGEKIRAITYTADFQIGNNIFDVKGTTTQQGTIRLKMFKYAFRNTNLVLKLITKAPKYSGLDWIEIDELKRLRKQRKTKQTL